MNVGLPPQTLQPQFSQPMQQFPPRGGQPGHATLPPSQAIPLPIAQPNMHITSDKSMPQINAQTPNNYSPGLGGPERPLSSSYTVRFWSVLISEFFIYSNLLGLDFSNYTCAVCIIFLWSTTNEF